MNSELYDTLSEREKEVLRLLAGGHEAKSVAQTLGLSVHTVNEYLRTARRKLDAPNSRAAARELAAYEEVTSKKIGTHEILGDEISGEAGPDADRHTPSLTARRTVRPVWVIGGLCIVILILASVLALTASGLNGTQNTQGAAVEAAQTVPAEAVTIAEEWLTLLDADDWSASHAALSPVVSARITARQWQDTVAPVRAQVGDFMSRTASEGTRSHVLPGMPDGDYAMQQFSTRFSNHATATETVVMSREADGWKVIGYFVR